jgi:predicted PurR-regulated permease PerM
MLYAFPILIALMLGYIFWQTAYRLRRDRLMVERARRSLVPVRLRRRRL